MGFSEWIAERGLSQSALPAASEYVNPTVEPLGNGWPHPNTDTCTDTCAAIAYYLGEPLAQVLRAISPRKPAKRPPVRTISLTGRG